MNKCKTIQSASGIIWKEAMSFMDTHSRQHIQAYIWESSLLLILSNSLGAVVRKEYIAPDGRYFASEKAFANYMGLKTRTIASDSSIDISCSNCSYNRGIGCTSSVMCKDMNQWDYKFK